MYSLTDNPNLVRRDEDGACIPRGHRWWDDYEAWCAAGNVPTPVPTLSLEDVAKQLIVAVQAWLDSVVQASGYDDIATCVSYANSGITQWAADGAAALLWRDAVWQACFLWQQNALTDPPAEPPTAEQVIAALPQPETFGWVPHPPGALS